MSDIADRAQAQIDRNLAASLVHRKPVPLICEECQHAPATTLPNGARSRLCVDCLEEALRHD